jgi:PIN domain nuclease of toxin-antitoxin system
MRLLLDTHIWIWGFLEPERLARRVRKELGDSNNELWLSPVSIWELFSIHARNRIVLTPNPEEWIRNTQRTRRMIEAPLTNEVALETGRSNLQHRDPADRFLVATANVYGLTLVTADRALLDARACALLPNR